MIAELDHHCGVFLDYDTPQPFHIHTVVRTPNGNDYGRELVKPVPHRRSVTLELSLARAGPELFEGPAGHSCGKPDWPGLPFGIPGHCFASER